jgi:tRNA threonylcarbamoyladenosine biosynthesis protein TsaB
MIARPIILHIESATNVCSVALSKGSDLIAIKESTDEKAHSAVLSLFIEEVLADTGLTVSALEAISVSKGPGSYTGLRIGVSVAKGLCYALDIPLIAVPTLQVLTNSYLETCNKENIPWQLRPMLDARRMEVYCALYNNFGIQQSEIEAIVIDDKSFEKELERGKVSFFGNGAAKCRDLITHPNAEFVDGILPSARFLIAPALEAFSSNTFENLAYFEPFYLKDFVATTPRKLEETLRR